MVDTLLTQLGFNRFQTNGNGERVMINEWRMFETAREEMPFWLFSKITADRAGVNEFWKIENDLKSHFSSTTDPENNDRDWNITVVNYLIILYKLGKKSNIVIRIIRDDSMPSVTTSSVHPSDPTTMSIMGFLFSFFFFFLTLFYPVNSVISGNVYIF